MTGFDDSGDWEPEDWGADRDDDVEELTCPSCGASVYEEAQQCPHCGDWITPLSAAARTPTWMRVVAGVVLFCFLYFLIAGIVRTLW
jgi:hypothetical protein